MDGPEARVVVSSSHEDTSADISRKEVRSLPSSSHGSKHPPSASSLSVTLRDGKHRQIPVGQAEDLEEVRRHRHHRHKHRKHESGSNSEAEKRQQAHKHKKDLSLVKSSAPGILEPTPAASQLNLGYVEDRKGDQFNLTYGSLHRYSIPRYRTAGYHRVVGLGRAHRILPTAEGNIRILSEDDIDSGTRVKSQSLLTGRVDRNVKVLEVRGQAAAQGNSAELQRDFLALDFHASRKRRRLQGHDSCSAEPSKGWPTTSHGKAQQDDSSRAARELSESDYDSFTSESESEPAVEDSFYQFRQNVNQQKSVELSKAVHDHPQDIEAWLSLINYQDIILASDRGITNRALSNAEKRGLIDVKVSIFETALAKNETHPERERLITGLLDEGSKIWDSTKLSNRWRRALNENPTSLALWIKYLDFQPSQFATFTYEKCKSAYAECLRIAGAAQAKKSAEIPVYILLRLTTYMKDAGFTEHAVGLWQAMLEFNLFRLPDVAAETARSSFEEFWNSEVARIGEEGANGWKSGSSREMAPMSDIANLEVASDNIFQSWPDCEQERSLNCMLPARTLDDVNEDDPYRVVISSDVVDYLFHLQKEEDRDLLIDAFLLFNNLPSLPVYATRRSLTWSSDTFLRRLEATQDNIAPESIKATVTANGCPVSSFIADTATWFSTTHNWFNCWQDMSVKNSASIHPTFRRLALRQLVDALPNNEHLAEFVIAFELAMNPKEVRKYAKALLKQRPSSLRLYNDFALVESRLGCYDAAERVWSTALSMSRDFPDTDRQTSILLWQTWIWELLNRGEPHKALALLLAIPNGQVELDKLFQITHSVEDALQSTALLKARRYLQVNLSQSISLRQGELICAFTDMLAILVYFSSHESIADAVAIYSTTIDTSRPHFSRTSDTLELLHQSRSRILHLHALTSRSGFRPIEITSALAESVQLFPSNTILLSLYHHHTQRSLLTDRIRTVIPTLRSALDDSTADNSVIPFIFNIWSEIHRPSYAGSTEHSIRAAFEHAVEVGKAAAHSMGIWRWYLLWELKICDMGSRGINPGSKNSTKLSRAQDVFYRGMRSCPWAKEIYLLAFTEQSLRDTIGFDGLRRIYETMVEKGIRIHVDLSELLED